MRISSAVLITSALKLMKALWGKDEVKGDYGPYKQSLRGEIYGAYVKDLIKKGFAYPCFCKEEQLDETRSKQENRKERTGYYGKYAACRNLEFEEQKRRIESGEPFVIRLKSPGSEENRIMFDDAVKGKIEMPENDEDFVLLKSDKIPTYHFAHAVDDHLMRTTHVMRGDEWISSTPKHLQLFRILGFKPPKYAHLSPIMKLDGGAKRKISKTQRPRGCRALFLQSRAFRQKALLNIL